MLLRTYFDRLELDGVGVKIAKKIQEILDTGKLNKLDKMLAKPEIQAINLYCRISGVGQAAAKYARILLFHL